MNRLLPLWLAQLAHSQPDRPHRACHWCDNLAWFAIGLLAGPMVLLLALALFA